MRITVAGGDSCSGFRPVKVIAGWLHKRLGELMEVKQKAKQENGERYR